MENRQADNVTVVLMPGLNGTKGLFRPLLDHTPVGCNVVIISYPTHEKLSYTELVPYTLKTLDAVQGRYILVGESFSGPLSLLIANEKPCGLVGIILVASFISAPNFRVGRFLPWRIGFTLTKPLYALRILLSKKESSSFTKATSIELQKVSPAVLADRMKSLFSVDVSEELRRCSVPILYFRGTKDFVVPRKNLCRILAVNSKVSVVEFMTQHFLLQAAPVESWKAISAFISEIR